MQLFNFQVRITLPCLLIARSRGLYSPVQGEQGAHSVNGLAWCYLESIDQLRGPVFIISPPCQKRIDVSETLSNC